MRCSRRVLIPPESRRLGRSMDPYPRQRGDGNVALGISRWARSGPGSRHHSRVIVQPPSARSGATGRERARQLVGDADHVGDRAPGGRAPRSPTRIANSEADGRVNGRRSTTEAAQSTWRSIGVREGNVVDLAEPGLEYAAHGNNLPVEGSAIAARLYTQEPIEGSIELWHREFM